MDRRRFLLTSLAAVIGSPVAAGAQQARKVPIIGAFSVPSIYFPSFAEGF
jgi:hypothetical protein